MDFSPVAKKSRNLTGRNEGNEETEQANQPRMASD
jgi:hypothetical protein